jgi:hypothetical protein
MKISTTLAPILVLAGLGAVAACSDDSGTTPSKDGGTSSDGSTTLPDGAQPDGGLCAEVLEGAITQDKKLSASCAYLIKGLVQVKAGATLTIEKGTKLRGESATKGTLLVQRGAKLVAEGTADEPIVFTSQSSQPKAGDWGGLVLLGKAPVNFPGGEGNVEGIVEGAMGAETKYGGTDPDDSSGVLRYVRVEYAGIVLSNNNEVNGVTFAGVGRGTKVDHVQVRMALDDCFEFFGGTVDAKYLACQSNEDDGFDFDNGYQGRLQFLVLQQSPTHAGDDNGFESDNDAEKSANAPRTSPTVYNATLCGKNADLDKQAYGLLLRANTLGRYYNVVALGFEAGVDLRDQSASDANLVVANSLFFGMKGPGVVDQVSYLESSTDKTSINYDDDMGVDEVAWWKDAAKKNKFAVDPQIPGCFSQTAPDFSPAASLATDAATPPSDGFFDTSATYMGAFKDASDKWATTGKWVVWSDK